MVGRTAVQDILYGSVSRSVWNNTWRTLLLARTSAGLQSPCAKGIQHLCLEHTRVECNKVNRSVF